ncbi:unnamed protein product [Ambrosiozyma monospora]|nr:unnamed protein product [Ambrosiozyma monospora]
MTLTQRKAHNKIERKYRININSKIANLQKLVPWMSNENIAFEVDGTHSFLSSEERGKKLNKSMILDMVTDYLVFMKEENMKLRKENDNLKAQLEESS